MSPLEELRLPPEKVAKVVGVAARLAAARLAPDDNGDDLDRLTSVPVSCRKPKALEYFRTRPGSEWTIPFILYQEKEGDSLPGDWWIVSPDLVHYLANRARAYDLRLIVNRGGAVYLFPIPKGNGVRDVYRASLLRAALAAETKWTRINWDSKSSGYLVYEAEGELSDPIWPDTAIPDMAAAVELAFADHIVDTEDHEVIQRARGLI